MYRVLCTEYEVLIGKLFVVDTTFACFKGQLS
jgi:hypothetical protein